MRLLGIPTSQGSMGKNIGAKDAPKIIFDKLSEVWLPESGRPINPIFEFLKLPSHMEETQGIIQGAAAKLFEDKPIFLGGDHSITYSTFMAFARSFKDPGLLIFDAHPDLMQPFNPVTHENYLAQLIEDGVLDPKNIILVGLRAWDEQEVKTLKNLNISFFSMHAISQEKTLDVVHMVMERAREIENLYVSIDIDVVDPAFAPGTGYKEPGGLTSRELLLFIQKIRLLKNVKAWDLVEVNPHKDIDDLTVKLAAKIIAELG